MNKKNTIKQIVAAIMIGMTATSAVIPAMTAAPVSCPIEASAASWESLKQTDTSKSYNNLRITDSDKNSTLCRIGCAVYSIYYTVMAKGLRNSSYTPGDCLKELKAKNAFNKNSEISWTAVNKAFPELTYTNNYDMRNTKRSTAISKVGGLLNQGYAVLVGVSTKGTTSTNHWVYVKSYDANKNTLTILDSGGTNQKTISANGSYSLNKIITYKVKGYTPIKSDTIKVGDTYEIYTLADTTRAITCTGSTNQANIILRKADHSNYQRWIVIDAGNGQYKLKNVATKKMMDFAANSTANYRNGINCQTYDNQTTKAAYSKTQMVSFKKVGDAYRILTYNTAFCVDCAGTATQIQSGKTNNVQVYQVGSTSNTTQLFIFKAV